MTEGTDDLSDLEGAEPAVEQSLDAWGESTSEPTWMAIEVEGELSGAGSAEPAPDPAADEAGVVDAEVVPDPETEPTHVQVAAGEPAPASRGTRPSTGNPYASIPPVSAGPSGGRSRRPSSLREALDERVASVPRRPLSPPPFTGAPQPDAPARVADTGKQPSAPAAAAARELTASLPQRLFALTSERPEVGLGVAFLGGLVLASILKRLGRR